MPNAVLGAIEIFAVWSPGAYISHYKYKMLTRLQMAFYFYLLAKLCTQMGQLNTNTPSK